MSEASQPVLKWGVTAGVDVRLWCYCDDCLFRTHLSVPLSVRLSFRVVLQLCLFTLLTLFQFAGLW